MYIFIKSYQTNFRPIRNEQSKDVGSLPFPVPAEDGHYHSFQEVYKKTKEVNDI